MKRWKALTGAAVALALVIAPLVSTSATAADVPVGKVGVLETWTSDTNKTSYWNERFADRDAVCYDGGSSHGSITDGGKTVTLKEFNPDWPGDGWVVLVIKGGSEYNNVIVDPKAGVAYASPYNNGGQQADVSHWIVCKGTMPPALASADVDVTDPSCGDRDGSFSLTFSHATVKKVWRDGEVVSAAGFTAGSHPSPTPGEYEIKFVADEGYAFGESKSITIEFTVPDPLTADDCAEVVTPAVPQWVDDCGLGNGFWSYPTETVGYQYVVATVEGSKVIKLVEDKGFRFPEGTVTEYSQADSGELCPVVVPTLFDAAPGAPTCELAGTVPTFEGSFPNVTFDLDGPEGGVAGVYTITVTPNEGFAFDPEGLRAGWTLNEDGSATRTFTVLGATGIFQNENSDAPCFYDTLPQPEVPVFTDECGTENDGFDVPEDTDTVRYVTIHEGAHITVTAVPTGEGDVFAEGTVTEWSYTFTDEDCPLIPGEIVSQCVGSVPYLAYEVELPEDFSTEDSTPLTITFEHPTDSSLDYVVVDQPLSGTLLWPGASAAAPQQWPGWVRNADGTYSETDGNYAWTRNGVTVRFDVNPTYSDVVEYPAESELCADPASAPKALPATGGTDMTPWGIGAALMLLAGAALIVTRRRLVRD